MAIPYYHVDSFTSELFAGNPAGVCILSAFLADSIMQKIAAENRHSETAFVTPRADGDFDLRWFTPEVEVDLCGHATLASAHVLWERGRLATDAPAGLLEALGITKAEALSTSGEFFMLVVADAATVRDLAPDFTALRALGD